MNTTSGTELVPTITSEALEIAKASAREDLSQSGGNPILKMAGDGDGTYSLGADGDPVEFGTQIYVVPNSMVHGWQCWQGGKPIDVNVVSMFKPLPQQDMDLHGPFNPRDSQEGWSRVSGCTLVTMDGEKWDYKPSSQGGRSALAKIATEFLAKAEEQAEACIPVIVLNESTSYYSKKRGKTFWNPVMDIIDWVKPDVVQQAISPGVTLVRGTEKPELTY